MYRNWKVLLEFIAVIYPIQNNVNFLIKLKIYCCVIFVLACYFDQYQCVFFLAIFIEMGNSLFRHCFNASIT